MSAELYRRAKEVFLAACDLDGERRQAILDRECGRDEELRREVESLLLRYDARDTRDVRGVVRGEQPPAHEERIGPYRVHHEIGRGGMGVVYVAQMEEGPLRRRVAIKVLKRGLDTQDILARFDRERQILAALNHPGIARLYDAGQTADGLPYLVMEHVEGIPIDRYCDRNRLHIRDRLELFRAVCDAVHHAHQNLVVHRDIKPSNILVTPAGPKLLDFGIAKLVNPDLSLVAGPPTEPELRVMTPEYASPEQVRGETIGTASDIYSLGVLLYELVTGHRPYRFKSRIREELVRVICDEDPERPSTAIGRTEESEPDPTTQRTTTITPESVSRTREGRPERLRRRLAGDIDNIVLMAMRKEQPRRYRSAEQFAEDIERHLAGLPVRARKDTWSYRSSKFVRRHRWGVGAAAVIGVLLVGGTAGTAMGYRQSRANERVAEARRQVAEDEQARAQAQRALAREQSELAERRLDLLKDMMHFITEDARKSIEPLSGALEARRLFADAGRGFIAKLAREGEGDPSLKRDLVGSYLELGRLQWSMRSANTGESEAALESYRQAQAIIDDLLKQTPADSAVQKDRATALTYIGDVMLEIDVEQALRDYEESLRICDDLLRRTPDDPAAQRDVAFALLNVGSALVKMGRYPEALERYERSSDLRVALASGGDDDAQRDLAVVNGRLGSVARKLGDAEGALGWFEKALEIRKTLAASDRRSARWQRDLSVSEYLVGDALWQLGRLDDALAHITEAKRIRAALVEADPGDARARRDLAAATERIGAVLVGQERWKDALQAYEEYRTACAELVAHDPADNVLRQMMARAWEGVALAHEGLGDLPAAIVAASGAADRYETLAADDESNAGRQENLARIRATLGGLLHKSGRSGEAVARLAAARDAFRSLLAAHPDGASMRAGLIDALLQLARVDREIGDAQSAVACAEEARALEDDDPSAETLTELALSLFAAGDRERGIDVRKQALAKLEGDQTAHATEWRAALDAAGDGAP
jgi:serine/threonine protein kinase